MKKILFVILSVFTMNLYAGEVMTLRLDRDFGNFEIKGRFQQSQLIHLEGREIHPPLRSLTTDSGRQLQILKAYRYEGGIPDTKDVEFEVFYYREELIGDRTRTGYFLRSRILGLPESQIDLRPLDNRHFKLVGNLFDIFIDQKIAREIGTRYDRFRVQGNLNLKTRTSGLGGSLFTRVDGPFSMTPEEQNILAITGIALLSLQEKLPILTR